ncbi:Rieske 2Fe-2S domain-containing protein [Sphingobium sp.]|uniref:Rieske 2Fe-2S domain-containing protein n=1 Tax=Sphingobium sp. TaxID=1912891 RepID=UPI0028BDE7FC|nr:Rieske 2Fe-2S domain-containing protein [Sphingobium sp.]
MLTEENNRLLTEVGPKTPLGGLMRQYWIPVMRSSQLKAGESPRLFKILGETFVAFRLPDGTVGIVDEKCPHRGASLALGRVEDCGLRCIYHGWQISPSGELLEAPTHPPSARLDKIGTGAHPVREGQGMIWTWLGRGEAPAFRHFSFTDLPDDHVIAATMTLHCGWLAPLETLWDVFHAQILHNDTVRASFRSKVYFSDNQLSTSSGLRYDYPEMLVRRTPYGFDHTNCDAAKDTHFRFILPFFQHHTVSPDPLEDKAIHIAVPIDDEHTLAWQIFYNRNAPLKPEGFGLANFGQLEDFDDLYQNIRNKGPRTPEGLWGWGQDRDAMERGESFAGFVGNGTVLNTLAEDFCVLESQGRVDRTREMLAPVDKALVEGRRTVLEAIAAHQRGEVAQGRDLDLSDVEALFISKKQAA